MVSVPLWLVKLQDLKFMLLMLSLIYMAPAISCMKWWRKILFGLSDHKLAFICPEACAIQRLESMQH